MPCYLFLRSDRCAWLRFFNAYNDMRRLKTSSRSAVVCDTDQRVSGTSPEGFTMQSNFNYHASRRGSVPDASANTTTPTNTGQGATDSVPNSRGISQAKPGTRARDEQLSALPRRRSRDESLSHQADQPEAQRPRVSPHPAQPRQRSNNHASTANGPRHVFSVSPKT